MAKNETLIRLLIFAKELFPDAKCELNYSKDYELAIAVMLSAQTTDKKVNVVTKNLFSTYSSLEAFANADFFDIERMIRPLGLSKKKAQNIIDLAVILLKKYDGILPSNKSELVMLPGIGNKSAGVIRSEVFKINDLAVDTHILRIIKRLNLVDDKASPDKVETFLKRNIPENEWIKTHHLLIFFGRYFCLAKRPMCDECIFNNNCKKENYSK